MPWNISELHPIEIPLINIESIDCCKCIVVVRQTCPEAALTAGSFN